MPTPDLSRRAIAEALGAFVLVFAGCGAVITDAKHNGMLGTAGMRSYFLVLVGLVSAGGHVSGARYNPGVTLALQFRSAMPSPRSPAQLVGATAAALRSSPAVPTSPDAE